ncbi:hypothetical protein [uncultured Thermosynechococcus sp.]|uniref:hypothetical protein n=1 Tax=uncultured Thermosynechococcus sp. TaxID=436945 RepID=UPI00262B43C7|nr:hypothetical protein [uncultured Thermosynechococcus sp.]
MNDLEKISKHLTPRPVFQGQIHVDSLRVPSSYPPDLLSSSPQLIREDLQRHRTNLVPLIIRPVEEGEYEVIFGKEIVEFARELGINHLFASRIELQDTDVPPFQERLKSIFRINQKADSSYSQTLQQSAPADQTPQIVGVLLETKNMFSKIENTLIGFDNRLKKIENKLDEQNSSPQRIIQELDELKRSLSELQQSIPKQKGTGDRILINRCTKPENLVKRVPNLTLEDAEKVIERIKQKRKFKSIDELEKIAPSGRWNEVSILFH